MEWKSKIILRGSFTSSLTSMRRDTLLLGGNAPTFRRTLPAVPAATTVDQKVKTSASINKSEKVIPLQARCGPEGG